MKRIETKTEVISLRCTSYEKSELNRLALESNLNVSNYIINTCLLKENITNNSPILPKIQTLINKYNQNLISKKKFIKEIIEMVGAKCQY